MNNQKCMSCKYFVQKDICDYYCEYHQLWIIVFHGCNFYENNGDGSW